MRPRRPLRSETYRIYSARAALGATNYLTTVTGGGLVLPQGAVFRTGADGIDTIGIPISELYPLVDPALQSIISADGGVTKRADAEIVALALASPYLNLDTMIGSAEKGVVIYAVGTTRPVLDKALGWFKLPLLITGSASRDATRLSTYNDVALAEIVGVDLSQYIGRKIAITLNSKLAIGWIGAAGGETLGANIFSPLDLTSGWVVSNAAVIDVDSFSVSANYGYVSKATVYNGGKLYKINYTAAPSAGSTYIRDQGSGDTIVNSPASNIYRTAQSTIAWLVGSTSGATIDVTALSVQHVSDVAVTGAKIYNSAAKTVQRFAVNAITTPNHIGGITFVVHP